MKRRSLVLLALLTAATVAACSAPTAPAPSGDASCGPVGGSHTCRDSTPGGQ